MPKKSFKESSDAVESNSPAQQVSKAPAFHFYVKDWLADDKVQALDAEQRGWYINLLAYAWQGDPIGTLDNNPQKLMRYAGVDLKLPAVDYEEITEEAEQLVESMFTKLSSTLLSAQLSELQSATISATLSNTISNALLKKRKLTRTLLSADFERRWQEVLDCFQKDGKRLKNKRLFTEGKKLTEWRTRQRTQASKGQKERWERYREAKQTESSQQDSEKHLVDRRAEYVNRGGTNANTNTISNTITENETAPAETPSSNAISNSISNAGVIVLDITSNSISEDAARVDFDTILDGFEGENRDDKVRPKELLSNNLSIGAVNFLTSPDPDEKPRRGKRLSPSFAPEAETVRNASVEYPLVDFTMELEKFLVYFITGKGKNETNTDWQRRFRSWLKQAQKWLENGSQQNGLSAAEALLQKDAQSQPDAEQLRINALFGDD